MGRLIIEFNLIKDAQDFLVNLDNLATVLHGQKGYNVWDEVAESPQGTFYVTSPTDDPRFSNWKASISFNGTEREFPPEWSAEV